MTNAHPVTVLSRRAAWCAVLVVLPAACGGGATEVTPDVVRERQVQPMPLGASSAQRFGRSAPAAPHAADGAAAAAQRAEPKFVYELPEGWKELEPQRFRPVNLAAPGGVEVWVTRMGAGAGGLMMNLTRWRQQVGLGPAEQADADALQARTLLGEDALLFDETSPDGDQRLVGLMLFASDRSVFVRMTGEPDAVAAAEPAFDAFVASLEDAPSGDTGGGPAAADAAPAPTSQPGDAPQGDAPQGDPPPGAEIAWTAPEDWTVQTPGMFQDAVWEVESGVTCAVSVYAGDGGGLAANVQRWARQAGQTPPADPQALPQLDVLGVDAWLCAFTEGPGEGLLALYAPLGAHSVFVKMTGPGARLEAQRGAFEAFCRTLRTQ